MNEENECKSFWMRFSKTGPIRFISHLDLTRAFHRAFFRAGIRLKTSSGFTPHPKFSFALPLSVGMESTAEYAAFTLAEGVEMEADTIRDRLNEQMPKGVWIDSVSEPRGKFSQIAFASYRVLLPGKAGLCFAATKLFEENEIFAEKRNKKGVTVEKNIKPSIRTVSVTTEGDDLLILCTLAASGEDYLNPELLVQALRKRSGEEIAEKQVMRTGVWNADGAEI